MQTLLLRTPEEFNFQQCLRYLGRSARESLHHIEDGKWIKAVNLNHRKIIFEVSAQGKNQLEVKYTARNPDKRVAALLVNYLVEVFDLTTDLKPFYQLTAQDALLSKFVSNHYGLRLIGIPDLFEAFAWAIIGQQINLDFAYTLKRRLVTQFGDAAEYEGRTLYLFPEPEKIASLSFTDLTGLQFSARKAEYVIGIAQSIKKGAITKESLKSISFEDAIHRMRKIRGVGNWTANYVAMKCLRMPEAFPLEDVGLHNALKRIMNLDKKPEIDMIKELSKSWGGWQAYITFYFWQTLATYA